MAKRKATRAPKSKPARIPQFHTPLCVSGSSIVADKTGKLWQLHADANFARPVVFMTDERS